MTELGMKIGEEYRKEGCRVNRMREKTNSVNLSPAFTELYLKVYEN